MYAEKYAEKVDFVAVRVMIDSFFMLDNDTTTGTGVSEAVVKIPAAKKDARKCSFMLSTVTAYKKQTNMYCS